MLSINPQTCRVETLIGSLLFLMTVYRRESRRDVAASIARHLECLAQHPDADETVRHVATGMCDEWRRANAVSVPTVAH